MIGMRRRLREWFGALLRTLADRIDDQHAVVRTGLSFTFEALPGGLLLRTDGLGCPLYRMGAADLRRAHDDADTLHAVEDSWDLAAAATVGIDISAAGTAAAESAETVALQVVTQITT